MKMEKIFSTFIMKHILWFILVFLLLVGLGFFRMYGVTFIDDITALVESNQFSGVWTFIFYACAAQFSFYFFRWIVAIICQTLRQKFALQIRLMVLNHLNKIPFRIFEQKGIGNLQAILRTDITNATEIVYSVFSRILTNVFMVLFSWGYICFLDMSTAIFVMVLGISLGIFNLKINQPVKLKEFETRNILGEISNNVVNFKENYETVKIYNASNFIITLYARLRNKYNESFMELTKINLIRENLIVFVENVATFGCILFFGLEMLHKGAKIGDLIVLISLLIQVLTPMGIIFRWMPSLVSSLASWDRVYQILELPIDDDQLAVYEPNVNSLHITNITYSYDQRTNILSNINMSFEKGNIYALVGESGKGKSTLLKILMGIYQSDSMEIKINNDVQIARSLGTIAAFVPSNPTVFNMSIYANIAMGNLLITEDICKKWLERMGLGGWINSLPSGLHYVLDEHAQNISGGQKQIISLARAFVAQQPVIILDEPFSSIDNDKEGMLLQILDEIKKDKIVLFTSHRESTLSCCDRIYYL